MPPIAIIHLIIILESALRPSEIIVYLGNAGLSIAGFKGTISLGIYAISKAAEIQLARNLAVEWGDRNIRVNSIAPGLIRTDFSRKLWEDLDFYATTIASYPLRRIGEPKDVAGAAVFLASDAAEFVTGQTIVVDGGATTLGGTVQR